MEHERAAYGREVRLLAALSYLVLLAGSLLLLIATSLRSQPFLRYHAVQSLFASAIILTIYLILIPGLTWLLHYVPILGGIFAFLAPFLYLAAFVMQLYWAFLAYEGRLFKLPGAGRLNRAA